MSTAPILELPKFDTGEYCGSDFLMTQGGASLVIHIDEQPPFEILFNRVRWHQFTALPNCTPEMIQGAYFRLIELPDSASLAHFLQQDSSPRKAYRSLHHYRIFLDETGCHELFAESAATPNLPLNPDATFAI